MMNYEILLTTYSQVPNVASSLTLYRRTIHHYQMKFQWSKVSQFDQKFRAELARKRSLEFHASQVDSFTQVFDASSLKDVSTPQAIKRCHRCNSTEHLVKMCPFQTQAAGTAPAAQSVCYKFNDGQCSFRGCRRAHKCMLCNGSHPKIWCQYGTNWGNASASQSSITSQPPPAVPPPGGFQPYAQPPNQGAYRPPK